jgi:hypothetical protein
MDANYAVGVQRGDISNAMQRANNIDFEFLAAGYMLNRAPDYYVFLYNVSEQSFDVSRPPLIRKFKIEGKSAGFKYKLCARFPQPLLVPKGNVDSNEIDIIPQDTRRFAMDIINPDNLGLDQDAVIKPEDVFAIGNNLGVKGVFWSLNGPGASKYGQQEEPTPAEIERATVRLEKFYRTCLEKADAVAASAPGELGLFLGPEHHLACDYFGEDRQWHGKKTRTDFCPNCGERIKAGAKFHKTEEGTLCILDWSGAVKAGVRTKAQAYEATEDIQFAPKQPEAPPTPAPAPVSKSKPSTPSSE